MKNHQARESIALLTKLLNADESGRKNVFAKERDEFYKVIERDLQDFLNKSSVPKQEKVYQKIQRIADSMELFGTFPELMGKTLIGVVALDSEICQRGLGDIVGHEAAFFAGQDTNIPCIFLRQDEDICATNDVGNQARLAVDEYQHTNQVLWREGIDIRQILQSFSLDCRDQFSHIAVVYFPVYFFEEAPFAQALMQKLDAVVLYASEIVEKSKQGHVVDTFRDLCSKRRIPSYVVVESAKVETELIRDIMQGSEIVPEHGIYSIFEQMNHPRHNGLFVDALELCLQDVQKFYQEKKQELHADQQMMTSDLTYITLEKTREAVKKLAKETQQKKLEIEEEMKLMRQVFAALRKKAEAYESVLENRAAASLSDESMSHCQATLIVWSGLFLQSLSMGEMARARDCLLKLKKAGESYGYIYDMLLQDAGGEQISEHLLNRLKNERDTEFVRVAKIRLRGYLGFSEIDYMRIARDIRVLTTADEFYFRARWEEHEDNLKDSVRYYKRALHLGSTLAAARLMELAKTSSAVPLQVLADEMVPEANFALGEELRRSNKFAASNRHFKLAAAKGHMPSIRILTDDMYRRLRHRKDNLSDEEVAQREMAIRLYQYVLQQEPQQEEVKERIGNLYYSLGDERRALEYWQQCETATAYYHRGRLFQYPDGSLPQNLDEALTCFKKASSLGHEKAGAEYNKVKRWKTDNARQKEMEEAAARSYAPRVERSSRVTESSGCFITSAACVALCKPDDCEELTALRAYRDKVKKEDSLVAALIEEYYRVAPLLVEKIDAEENASRTYRRLWDDSIRETYHLVGMGRYEEATLCYIRMTKDLCARYDIAFSEGIAEKIEKVQASIS